MNIIITNFVPSAYRYHIYKPKPLRDKLDQGPLSGVKCSGTGIYWQEWLKLDQGPLSEVKCSGTGICWQEWLPQAVCRSTQEHLYTHNDPLVYRHWWKVMKLIRASMWPNQVDNWRWCLTHTEHTAWCTAHIKCGHHGTWGCKLDKSLHFHQNN